MTKYLMIVYSNGVAAASFLLNRSLIEGFRVQKFRTNFQSGWSVQEMGIVIASNGKNIKEAESILNYSIQHYQAIKPTAISFVARIKLRIQSLKIFPLCPKLKFVLTP